MCARSGKAHPLRPVLTSTDLCTQCHTLFTRTLEVILDRWTALEESVLRRPARTYSDMPSGSGEQKDASVYWNPAASMVLDDLTGWVSFLARTISNERPAPIAPAEQHLIHGPLLPNQTRPSTPVYPKATWALHGTIDPRLALATIIRWHHSWLTHHPSIGAALLNDAIRYEWATAKALNPAAELVTRITLNGHHCQIIVEETEYGDRICEGQLVGVIRPNHHGEPSAIMCTINPGHATPAGTWAELDAAKHSDQYITIDDAATYLNLTTRSAYRYATTDNWRTNNSKPQRFHLADIHTTAQRRNNDA